MKLKKIEIVARILIYMSGDITPLALQKALYYVQGFSFVFFKQAIFNEDCEAWVHGPVYREIYTKYKTYAYNPIDEMDNNNFAFDKKLITELEFSLIKSIVTYICCYSGAILEKFTHLEAPWIITRGKLTSTELSSEIISKNEIEKYFLQIKEEYNIERIEDIKNYTDVMFKNVNCL
ncbi:Panacea domain-containing protein [Veillonella criceti]|uniref:Uncharacterized phage-associated protein n=1 Tax=Veillonella criceti TaxID=103891 RepID=A0A380NH66_9FIRM|nr:type II toxin-antitoxin system antitoxin SocA domain-containing protein [Veillonella criceti]SUP41011.1 Uncharacterized phage-associated protein [Veillonella criceti]